MAAADPLVDTLVDLNPLPRLSLGADFTKLEPPQAKKASKKNRSDPLNEAVSPEKQVE